MLLAVAVGGCYTYVPLDDGRPERGDEIRVHLTPGTADRPTSPEERRDADLEGVVVSGGPDSLSLWRRPVMRSGSRVAELERDTVAVALSEVRRMERSELDALRTGGLVLGSLGLIAGAAILVANAEAGGTGDLGGGNGDGTLGIQVPLP